MKKIYSSLVLSFCLFSIQAQNVGVGTANPLSKLNVSEGTIINDNYAAGAGLNLWRAEGTQASPTDLTINGTTIGNVNFGYRIGGSFNNFARIRAILDETASSATDAPAALTFWTTANGTGAITERMRISGDGNVGIGSLSPSQRLDVNGFVALEGKLALQGNDTWLRLNQTGAFTTGVYTPGFLRVDGGIASGGLATPGGGAITATGHINSNTGFRISNAAASGAYLRGNGTNFVSSGILAADIPAGSGNYIQNQYSSAQSANSWISGETRTGGWFRNSSTNSGLYNEADISGIWSVGPQLMEMFNNTSLRFQSAAYLDFGSATRQMINLWGGGPNAQYGIGIQSNTLYYRSASTFSWHVGGTHSNAANNPGGGTEVMRLTNPGDLAITRDLAVTRDATIGRDITIEDRAFLGDQGVYFPTAYDVRSAPNTNFHDSNLFISYRDQSGSLCEDFLGFQDNEFYFRDSDGGSDVTQPGVNARAFTTYSSKRWKTNIQPLTGSLDLVQKLRGVRYNYVKEMNDGKPSFGFIAEEVYEVLPEIVGINSEIGISGVDYGHVTPVLVEAIKEQQLLIEKLQTDNANKEINIAELNKKYDALNTELMIIKNLLIDQQSKVSVK